MKGLRTPVWTTQSAGCLRRPLQPRLQHMSQADTEDRRSGCFVTGTEARCAVLVQYGRPQPILSISRVGLYECFGRPRTGNGLFIDMDTHRGSASTELVART